jgi:hypothetical protein
VDKHLVSTQLIVPVRIGSGVPETKIIMRLWTIHPKYLDRQGLGGLWREGLLALKVLRNQTSGYKHHPQLQRFRATGCPVQAVNGYLYEVLLESRRRGYKYDGKKVRKATVPMLVTKGQLHYEREHLKKKLASRSPERRLPITPDVHPMFYIVGGAVEYWERIKS